MMNQWKKFFILVLDYYIQNMKISLDASQRILQLDFEISHIIVANTNDFESKMTTRSNVTTPTTYGNAYGSKCA